MIIRRELDLGAIRKANVCITRMEGYPHTEAFREIAERIEEECRRNSIPCSITSKVDEDAEISFILGAHLMPEQYKILDKKNTIIVNLERLAPLESNKINNQYLELIKEFKFIDFTSENSEFCRKNKIHEPLYIYRPWHEAIWSRVQAEAGKEWDACFIGSITPRRQNLINCLERGGIKVKTAFNCYSAERDLILSKSKIALNIHAYAESNSAEIWRLGYYISNNISIVSEKSCFEEGEESISRNLVQADYDNFTEVVRKELIRVENYSYKHQQLKELNAAATKCSIQNNGTPKKIEKAPKPLTLNIGCGIDWHEDALNIDIKTTGAEDLVLDISKPWEKINRFHQTQRFGLIYLGECCFDIIEASCVLEHVEDLTKTLQNLARLLKPGGWLFLRFPHQDSLGAWQDPTHVRGMNEHLFKYLNEWSEYIELGDIKLKPKWMSFIEEESKAKINKQDFDRTGFVEAVTVKEIVSVPKRRSKDQIEKLKEARKKIGGTSLRDKINRRTYIETYETNIKDRQDQKKLKNTVSLLTPTYGNRFKYLRCASKWIANQDYPATDIEWVILTDTDDEADFLRSKLKFQREQPRYRVNIQSAGEKLPIGAKRNLIHNFCEGEIYINIDDDDYYMPSRISHCIDKLNVSDADYAGCRYLPVYFTDDNTLWISDPGENIACAGSFAYRKELLKKTWYPHNATNGEEIGFTNDFSLRKADLDAFSTMICIAHSQNTFDKNKLRSRFTNEAEDIFKAGSEEVFGDRNFFNAGQITLKETDFQAEWKSAYALIEENSESLNQVSDFFCHETPKSALDTFANFIINKLN